MPAPVRIQFQTVGTAELQKAFDMAEARLKKLAQLESRTSRMAKQSSSAANDNAQARSAKEQLRAMQEVARYRKESMAAALKQSQVEGQRARNARTELQTEKEKLNIRRQELMLSERAAKVGERSSRQQAADARRRANAMAREQKAMARQQGARVGRLTGMVGRAGRSTLGTITGVAGGLGLSSAGFMAADAIQRNIALEEQAAQLVNATREGPQGAATQTVAGLAGEAQGMAAKYGVSAESVMAGMQTVAARAGGAEGLRAMRKDLEDLTQTAVAYGVSMEDMGGVVAAALNAGVAPGEEMRAVVQQLVAQGKEGSIEFADLASELARLAGEGRGYEMKGSKMVSRMVALSQIAARARVSPEESRTAVVDISRDITTRQKYLEKSGITDIFNPKGGMRDPADLLSRIIGKAETEGVYIPGIGGKGDAGRRKGESGLKMLFTGTSQAVILELLKSYRGAGGGAAGEAAVKGEIEKFSNAGLAPGERDVSLKAAMGTTGNQAKRAMETFYRDMSALTPKIAELLPPLTQVATALADLGVKVANNPIKGIGVLFAGYLAKEIAAAQIGSVIQSLLTKQVAGSGVEKSLGGINAGSMSAMAGLKTFSGALGAAGAALGGLALGWQLGEALHEDAADTGAGAADKAGNLVNKAKLALQGVRTGQVGSKTANAMAQELEERAASIRETQAAGKSGWSNLITLGAASTEASKVAHLDPAAMEGLAKQLRGATYESGQKNLTEFLASIQAANEGIKELGDAAKKSKDSLVNPLNGKRGGGDFSGPP